MRQTTPLVRASALALAACLLTQAQAADTAFGKVISKVAVYVQVQAPQQQCTQQEVLVKQPNSGTGAVVGALAGGVLGNALGKGAGNALATGVGVIAGAVAGDKVESNANPPQATSVQNCQTVQATENRFAGYDVTYEYMDQRYTARVAHDPGDAIALLVQVTPVDALPVAAATTAPAAPPVVYVQPPVIYRPAPVYVGPAIGLNLGWGWGWGRRH